MGYSSGVGREAPAFTITAVDGSEINLRQYRGDWFPVLVFVPAQAESAPLLERLSAAAATLWGLRGQLLGVCAASRDEVAALASKVENLSFPLLPAGDDVARAYGALKDDGGVRPLAFIVDRAGKIVWTGDGTTALEPESLLAAFRQVAR